MPQPHKGSWFGLPDFGITEKIAATFGNRLRTAQGGSNPIGSQQRAASPQVLGSSTKASSRQNPNDPKFAAGNAFQGYARINTGSISPATPAPATSGESYGGGASAGGDGGGDTGYDYMGALRSNYDTVRKSYENLLPTYDSDYANFKTNTEAAIGRARDTLNTQNAEDEQRYGQNLKQLLQSDRELRQRQQGVFSSLNALDSSAYRDDVTKADQVLLENQQGLRAEKDKYYNERQKAFNTYEQEANSKIAAYGNEIERAKQSLKLAVASTNMEEAASLQSYINQLQADAANINQQKQAYAANLLQLQAQGVDVVGNLNNLNMADFSNTFGQGLRNRLASVTSRYSLPAPAFGSGYINPRTGRAYTDEGRRFLGV